MPRIQIIIGYNYYVSLLVAKQIFSFNNRMVIPIYPATNFFVS